MAAPMIVLFTDFGLEGPYVGQVKAALLREAPETPVIDLCHDAPAHRPDLAAYLLAAWLSVAPRGAVILGVVDPGVGGPRRAIAVEAGGRWFVGPDNGLFAIAVRRAGGGVWRAIEDGGRPLSASFHGRDLFAPVAAAIARGAPPAGPVLDPGTVVGRDWPDDLARIAYIDRFGNAATGFRAGALARDAEIEAGGRRLVFARTFADAAPGAVFWYENANGLVEIAANQASAAAMLGLGLGDSVAIPAPS